MDELFPYHHPLNNYLYSLYTGLGTSRHLEMIEGTREDGTHHTVLYEGLEYSLILVFSSQPLPCEDQGVTLRVLGFNGKNTIQVSVSLLANWTLFSPAHTGAGECQKETGRWRPLVSGLSVQALRKCLITDKEHPRHPRGVMSLRTLPEPLC
jgi:hypothetical protein